MRYSYNITSFIRIGGEPRIIIINEQQRTFLGLFEWNVFVDIVKESIENRSIIKPVLEFHQNHLIRSFKAFGKHHKSFIFHRLLQTTILGLLFDTFWYTQTKDRIKRIYTKGVNLKIVNWFSWHNWITKVHHWKLFGNGSRVTAAVAAAADDDEEDDGKQITQRNNDEDSSDKRSAAKLFRFLLLCAMQTAITQRSLTPCSATKVNREWRD